MTSYKTGTRLNVPLSPVHADGWEGRGGEGGGALYGIDQKKFPLLITSDDASDNVLHSYTNLQ